LHFFTELLARAAARASPIDYVKKVLSKSPLAWEAIRIGLLFTFMRDGYNPAHVEKMIKNVLRANTDAMAISMLALFRLDETLYERAADIKVPVWLIAGDDDPLISEESVRRLANRIPGSRLEVFHGVGHFPMLSDATKFNETIRCFMEEVSALQRV
jgi:pimeloyl-ACP methyl ester carboxylesterase